MSMPPPVRRKPRVLRPGFVEMRGQWSYDHGMQDYEYTPHPHEHPLLNISGTHLISIQSFRTTVSLKRFLRFVEMLIKLLIQVIEKLIHLPQFGECLRSAS